MTGVLEHPDDRLSALLDGELDFSEAASVRAHVAGCSECAAELDAVRRVRAAIRSLPAVEPPAGFFEALLAEAEAEAIGGERATGEPADGGRTSVAPVVSLRDRRAAWANAAAAVAAGLVLVVGFGGNQAQAVAPHVTANVERHAATTSAASLGGSDPILGAGEVTPTSLPHTGVSRPYTAPHELAGYTLVDAYRAPQGLQLLYQKGGYGLSVFEQEGDLDYRRLPREGSRLDVGGRDAWRWEGGTVAGRVLVVERGDLVLTLVGDESAAAVQAAAEAFPGSPAVAWGTRLRRACGQALDMLSPAG